MTTLKRRTALLVAVSAVSGVMMLFSPTSSPAQAAVHDVCVGAGSATLASSLVYPVSLNGPTGTTNLGTSSAHSSTYTFHFNTASTCAMNSPALSATGSVHGWCGLSVGSGTTSTGGAFHWVGVGGTLVVTGQIVGVVNAVPDTVSGSTCSNHTPGASRFLVNGGGLQQSCGLVSLPSQSVGATSVSAGVASAHIDVGMDHIFASVHQHPGGPSTSVSVPLLPSHLGLHPSVSVCA